VESGVQDVASNWATAAPVRSHHTPPTGRQAADAMDMTWRNRAALTAINRRNRQKVGRVAQPALLALATSGLAFATFLRSVQTDRPRRGFH
jgi:hypothetical protein